MKSSILLDCSDNEGAASEFPDALGGDDFRVNSMEGFDHVHLTSLLPSTPQESVRPTFFSNENHQDRQLEGNVGDTGIGDIDGNTVATPCECRSPTARALSPSTPPMSTPLTSSPRRCNTAPWDERINWSKSKSKRRRSVRSVNSDGSGNGSTSSDSSVSTQLLQQPSRPAAMLQRNTSSSTSSSSLSLSDYSLTGDHELQESDRNQQVVESRNPIFFSPRRRLNSLVHTNNRNGSIDTNALSSIPVAVVSIPILADTSISSIHDDRIHISSNNCTEDDGGHNSRRGIWCLFASQSLRKHANQRRNLLLLFLIATYTTFGLASPNIQKAATTLLSNSKIGNVIVVDDAVTVQDESFQVSSDKINDVLFVMDDRSKRTSTSLVESSATVSDVAASQLRGSSTNKDGSYIARKDSSVINSHLSFARGGSNANSKHPPLLVYRRREVNDFYHQPALLQDDTTATNSWYLNCFVLFIIAIYYVVREHRKIFLSCTTTDCSSGTNGAIIHNTHQL